MINEARKSQIPIFVVNLKKDVERRRQVEGELKKINAEFVMTEAVCGKEISLEELKKHYDKEKAESYRTSLTLGEVGCSLSHISIYDKIIAEGISYALILEDDATLSPDVMPVIDSLTKAISPERSAVVLLTHVNRYTKRKSIPLTASHFLVSPISRHVWRAHGYFVTLTAARRMKEFLYPVWAQADDWRLLEKKDVISLHAVAPYCIGLSECSSNLELDRKSKKRPPFRWNVFFDKNICEQLKKLLWPFLRVVRQKRTW